MLFGGVYARDPRSALAALSEKGAKRSQEYERRRPDEIERVVIHHVGAGANRDYSAEEIARYHVESLGWPGVGYHFLVHPDGRVEYIGDWLSVRYHCGRLNRSSLGICLAGDFTMEMPTRPQLMRARMLVLGVFRELGQALGKGGSYSVPVVGHGDLSPASTGYPRTACPGTTWPLWCEALVGLGEYEKRDE